MTPVDGYDAPSTLYARFCRECCSVGSSTFPSRPSRLAKLVAKVLPTKLASDDWIFGEEQASGRAIFDLLCLPHVPLLERVSEAHQTRLKTRKTYSEQQLQYCTVLYSTGTLVSGL